jgi:hypothetical protein
MCSTSNRHPRCARLGTRASPPLRKENEKKRMRSVRRKLPCRQPLLVVEQETATPERGASPERTNAWASHGTSGTGRPPEKISMRTYLQTATPNPRRCPLGTCGGEHLYLGRHEDHAGVERALGVVFPTTASRWGATTHARMPGNPSPAVRGPVRGGLVLVPRAIGSAGSGSGSGSGLLVGEPRRTPFSFFLCRL